MKDPNAQIELFLQYLAADGLNARLHIELGDLCLTAGRLEEAGAWYEKCLLLVPGHRIARSRLAHLALDRRDHESAEALLRSLIEDGDASPVLRHNLGLCLFALRRWSDAARCFEEASVQGCRSVQGLACWTQALHVLGEFESAARVGRQWVAAAVAQDHASALEARSYLSIVLLDAGDVAESRALAAEVARERPADPGANVVLGLMAMESHDVQAAQTSFQAAAASARYVGRAWQGIALVHLHESRFEPACDALRHAIEADGRDVGSVVTLGWVHLLSGDIAAAREAFERAVQTDRNFAESHGGMASVMAVEGDLAGARQASRRARRLNRHGFGAEFADAVALDAAGARQDAMASVQRALHRTLPRAGEQPLIHHVRRYLESRRAHPDPQHRSET